MSNAEALEQSTGLEIAVIGLAGRFPGAGNVEQFWRNLRDGVESISFFSDEELLAAGVNPALLQSPNFVKARGVLEDAELFDAEFFGYNPREAEIMDPQQRVFLECAWEALENAGYDSETCNNRIGVYAGVSMNTYFVNLYSNPELLDAMGQYQTFIGNDKDFIATRPSYKMNLTGPSMVIQTACSTSLVAVHQACRALLSGECDMALAGAASVSLPQKAGYLYQEEGIMSPDGHCRAFDAKAQGTVGGNGVAIVVLKRLEDALSDGDHIRAVIKGTAINNDGSLKVGYTAPSVEGQAQAIRAAQLMAEVEPETISYIETHGTGTTLGDPIEITALTEAFSHDGEKKNYCAIGSVKTNIGHLDVAAGVAGLIKTVLALEHKQLPPSLNFEQPNPGINFDDSPFYVNERLVDWKTSGAPLRAGISSFGLGGTNAHAVLEEAPPVEAGSESREWQLLTVSARSAPALETATTNLATHLRENPDLNFADVAYTLKTGRRRFTHRATLVCRNTEEAIAALETGSASKGFREPTEWSVVFMFPGGGAQYPNMGLDLYKAEPTYRQHIDACLELLDAQLSFDLREVLFPSEERFEEAARQLRKTSVALPALFITEYALAKLWMSWGINPEALIGHSLGEYVAACLAGVFSLEDALSLVVLRGRLFEKLPAGSMLSVSLPETEVRAMLDERLSIAAINSPSLCVVSGATEAIEELAEKLNTEDIDHRRLLIDVAAHSPMVTPILEEFTRFVERLQLNEPVIPFISNVTGTWISAAQATTPVYWAKHLRHTVRFGDGIRELLQEPNRMLLEVGPGQTLSMLANMQATEAGTHPALNSMRHPSDSQPDTAFLLATLGKLWTAGININWKRFYDGERRRRVPLPAYPFERQRYWVEFNNAQTKTNVPPPSTRAQDIADWFYLPTWKPERLTHTASKQEKESWLIFADEDGFASSISKRLDQQGADVFTVRMGEEFERVDERSFIVNPVRSEDYDAVLSAVGTPQSIVHGWSIARETARSTAELFRDAQAKGYYSLLFLTQALERAGLASHERTETPLRLTVISNDAQAVTGVETARPEKATLVALCKVIPQEYQNILCRSIDVTLPPASTRQEAGLVDSVISEIRSDASERLIAYRGKQRWTQTFEPLRIEAAAEGSGYLREKGVYLITGGMGGVGLLLAKRLAQTVRARIVLAGRRIRKLQELEDTGAEVLYRSVDVSDEAQVRALIDEIYERFGTLDGVFHAAGTTHGKSFSAPLSELGIVESEEQFRAKVYGAYSLAKALDGRALDFCMLFSSNSAVLGGLGFGAYSAANLFLDSFAASESKSGSTRWVSANWDGWLLSDEQAEESVAHTSMAKYAMKPQESIEALERILASPVDGSVAVSNWNLQGRLDVWLKRNETAGPEAVASSEQNVTLHPRPNLKTPYVAPSNEVEQSVAAIWRQMLGMDQVGINDNFFELGGHSLLATRIVTQLRDAFHVKLPLRSLFESPTVAQISVLILARLAEERVATESKITRRARTGGSFPLSFAQQRLWFLDQLDPGNHIYNEASAIRLTGTLNTPALARSFDEIIRRHEVLRTTFSTLEGQPVQVIAPHLKLHLSHIDLSKFDDGEREAEIQRLAIAESLRPFDLSSAPFMRVTLVRMSPNEHVLLLTMHHIISDAWSTGILVHELVTLYIAYSSGRTSPLAELPVQYADYAAWQRDWLKGEELERQLDYWRKELSGAPPVINLPADRSRPEIRSYRGGNYSFVLPEALTASIRALSRSEEVTVFNTLLAAFQTLLYRLTAQEDIVIGANIANRNHAGTESLIGFFINMLSLRADLAGDPSFRELLNRVRKVTLGAYAHQDLPFDKLIEELQPERIPGVSPLFQVVFNYYAPEPLQQIPGLKLEPLSFDYEVSRFDLSLIMSDREGTLSGVWKYSTELFDAGTVARIHGHFETLLQSITAQPDARLSTLEMFTQAEQQQRMTVNKELKKSNFKKFVGVKPKAITTSTKSLVHSRSLRPGERVPLLVEPEVEDVDLSSWAANNRVWIDAQLVEHGAILFRNFNVDSVDAFHQLARAVSGELLDYVEPSSPRSEIGNKIYTSTEYPPDQWIFLHNEMSYALHWPRKVFFYCVRPAVLGGETPLACSRKVFDLIDPAIREQFIAKKVMYVRNFGDGLHRPWQDFFRTKERSEVDAYCLKAGIQTEWLGGNRLRIRQVCQSVVNHPETGVMVWFNQAHAFHVSSLDPAVRSVLLSEMEEADIPRNAYYGDGTTIEDDTIAAIQEAYRRATILFPWQARDVLFIDNMAVAHGRAPFSGPRQILVAMAEPHSSQVTMVN